MIPPDSIRVFYPATHIAHSRDSFRCPVSSGLDCDLALHQIYHCAINSGGTNGSSLPYAGAGEGSIGLTGCALHNSSFRNHICIPSVLGRAVTLISP